MDSNRRAGLESEERQPRKDKNEKKRCLLRKRDGQLKIMWLKSQIVCSWCRGNVDDEFNEKRTGVVGKYAMTDSDKHVEKYRNCPNE